MMKRIFTVCLVAMLAMAVQAQGAVQGYTVDKNGDVVATRIVEGLALKKQEIYEAGLKYLREAYKETKYKIVIESAENGVVAGEGKFLAFHEANIFPYSYFLDAPFCLRIDAKDNRARVAIIFSYYDGKRTNINETVDIHDHISDFAPINSGNSDKRRLYQKAFPLLLEKAGKTLTEVEEMLKSTRSVAVDTDW